MPRFVTMGELLVDFVSTKKGYTIGGLLHPGLDVGKGSKGGSSPPAFVPVPGGAPANVAVGISLLGGDAGFIGNVGDDPFGKRLAEILKDYGVDTGGVSFSKDARTMLAFVSLTKEGERDFVFFRHPSADMMITAEDIPKDYLKDVSYFHFGSISLITEPARGTTLDLISSAKEGGAVISFDPNIRLNLWPGDVAARDQIMSVIPSTDILKLSAEESYLLTREADPKISARILAMMGPKLVVVTLGAKGSVAVNARYGVEVLGYKVKVSDTTGAGDAFTAAMLWYISQLGTDDLHMLGDLDMIRVFKFANAAGALTTKKRGAIPALPTRGEVDLFLKDKK